MSAEKAVEGTVKAVESVAGTDAAMKFVGVLDKNIDKIADAVSRMGGKISEYVLANGDNALDLLLLGARIDALNEIADCLWWFTVGGILYAMFGAMAKGCVQTAKDYEKYLDGSRVYDGEERISKVKAEREIDSWKGWSDFWIVTRKFITSIFVGVGVYQALNVWAIAGLIRPEVWVAKKILEKTGVF